MRQTQTGLHVFKFAHEMFFWYVIHVTQEDRTLWSLCTSKDRISTGRNSCRWFSLWCCCKAIPWKSPTAQDPSSLCFDTQRVERPCCDCGLSTTSTTPNYSMLRSSFIFAVCCALWSVVSVEISMILSPPARANTVFTSDGLWRFWILSSLSAGDSGRAVFWSLWSRNHHWRVCG